MTRVCQGLGPGHAMAISQSALAILPMDAGTTTHQPISIDQPLTQTLP